MANLSPSVAAELVRLLYRYVPAVLAANLVNGCLVVASLWPQAGHRLLLGWLSAVAVLGFGRVA
ncbi:MAG: hypothetical protein ACM3XS_02905, partial [Bacteroidota bacterium]